MNNKPLLSIITIVYNHKEGLIRTAESVKNINNPLIEWLIIDGASNDGSVEVIKLYEKYINKWISEKDKGISDAFNKGVQLASGNFVLFLNAGDIININSELLLDYIKKNINAPCIVGKIKMNNRVFGKAISFWRQYMRNHLPHQAMFINRKCFDKYGGYDVNRKLGMDYEWSLRLKEVWLEIVFIPEIVSIMEPGGISVSNPLKTFQAYREARVLHFHNKYLSYMVYIYYILKSLLTKPIRPILNYLRS